MARATRSTLREDDWLADQSCSSREAGGWRPYSRTASELGSGHIEGYPDEPTPSSKLDPSPCALVPAAPDLWAGDANQSPT
jgi:hypothetical protein